MEIASFGGWVRRRRRTLDLTQVDLAAAVACAPITIRKIEADERRPSRTMAERLADALGLEGDDRDRFVAAGRASAAAALLRSTAAAASFGPLGAVPSPLNRLIGRRQEVLDILERLATNGGPARLVTVVGPPGVGKTRLAVEVARLAEQKLDLPGVFVDLSPVESADDVPARIAAAVTTPTAATIDVESLTVHALGRTPTLLVVDNVEHVRGASAHLTELLSQCPDLVCVATSRVPLDVYGEHVWRLEPFDLDAPDESVAAAELFVERVEAAGRRPRLDPADETVQAVCRTVDGLPLALELAALRAARVEPEQVLRELAAWEGGLGAVGRGGDDRLRSARGAVAWSQRLLSADAADVLVVASVFSGSFTADLLEAVGRALDGRWSVEVSGALEELEAHALVHAEGGGWFRLLAVVREFGRAQVEDEGRHLQARSAHAEVVADVVEVVSPGVEAWPEPDVVAALGRLDPDARSALVWSFGHEGDPGVGRRILGAVLPVWHLAGLAADCTTWSRAAYDSAVEGSVEDRYRYEYYLATSRWAAGDAEEARRLIEAAAAGAEAAQDTVWYAEAVGMQQLLALSRGDLDEADRLTSSCIAAADRAGGEWQLLAHLRAASVAVIFGRVEDAAAEATISADLAADHPSSWGAATTDGVHGDVALAQGRTDEAIDRYLAAAGRYASIDAVTYTIGRIAGVANALTVAGRTREAAQVYGLVDAWNEDLGTVLIPPAALAAATHRPRAEAALGRDFASLAEVGASGPRSLAEVERLVRSRS